MNVITKWTRRFIHLFNRYLWNIYWIVGTILDTGNLTLDPRANVLPPMKLTFWWGEKIIIKKPTKVKVIEMIEMCELNQVI